MNHSTISSFPTFYPENIAEVLGDYEQKGQMESSSRSAEVSVLSQKFLLVDDLLARSTRTQPRVHRRESCSEKKWEPPRYSRPKTCPSAKAK